MFLVDLGLIHAQGYRLTRTVHVHMNTLLGRLHNYAIVWRRCVCMCMCVYVDLWLIYTCTTVQIEENSIMYMYMSSPMG